MKIRHVIGILVLVAVARVDGSPEMPVERRVDRAAAIAAASQVTEAAYPNADVVLVDNSIHSSYEADGRDVTWDDEWSKAMTERGRRQLATLTVPVARRYSDAEIQCVEIVGTNGVVRTVDFVRTMKEATDNSSMHANIYDPMDHVITCALPGLAVGEMRHVVVCRRVLKPRLRDAWCDRYGLEATYPIRRTTVSVDAPDVRPLVRERLRNPSGDTFRRLPERTTTEGRRLYAWQVADVPQIIPEPYMPALSECAQTLHVATIPDWSHLSKWYWNLCAPHLARTNAALVAKVAELTSGKADAAARMRALYRFVAQDVRYMGLTLEDSAPGYEPHDVDFTFGNRYGVCRDKAALLVAMLRLAGFRAFPVLINVGEKMDDEVPSPHFNHAVVAVDEGPDRYTLLDPTVENSHDIWPSQYADLTYLVARPEGERLRVVPPPDVMRNLLDVDSDVELSPDGSGLVRCHIVFNGVHDIRWRDWFVRLTPASRMRIWCGWVDGAVPGCELVTFRATPEDLRDTSVPMSFDFTCRVPSLLRHGEGMDVLRVPSFSKVLGGMDRFVKGAFMLQSRRFPVKFQTTVGARERLVVHNVPRALSLPPDVRQGDEVLGYSVRCSASAQDDTLELVRDERLLKTELSADEFARVRGIRETVEKTCRSEVRLAADPLAECDVRTLLSKTDYHFTSPTSWVQTNVVRSQVLNVNGKAELAEICIPYHPDVRSVRVVKGTVAGKDGVRRELSEREINVMDADWVAWAPRYPNSRQLVVNLPGVEVGSTVETVIERIVTHAPMPYCEALCFNRPNWTDCSEIAYHVPSGMPFAVEQFVSDHANVRCSVVTNAFGNTTWNYVCERPEPRLYESSMPHWTVWGSGLFIHAGRPDDFAERIAEGLSAARKEGSKHAADRARQLVAGMGTESEKIYAIRNWICRNVRTVVCDPLYRSPLEGQFFSPDRSLADGYASRHDRMNLLRAMLEAVGFSVESGLSAWMNAGEGSPAPALARNGLIADLMEPFLVAHGRDSFVLDAFADLYTPAGATSFGGRVCYWLDRRAFGVVPDPDENVEDRVETSRQVDVAADGAVRIVTRERKWGVEAGSFRRTYSEIRDEIRRHQAEALARAYGQDASVVGVLETDVEAYPVESRLKVDVRGLALVQDGVMTVSLPKGAEAGCCGNHSTTFLPDMGCGVRMMPIVVSPRDSHVQTDEVVFPAGWTEIVSLPKSFVLTAPGEATPWFAFAVSKWSDEAGRLHVRLETHSAVGRQRMFSADYADLFRAWRAKIDAVGEVAVSVRKPLR